MQMQSKHNYDYQQYGGLVTFLRLPPGISKVCTMIGVEKFGGPHSLC